MLRLFSSIAQAVLSLAVNANTGLSVSSVGGAATISKTGYTTITDSATPTLDASLNDKFKLSSTQNCTMTITNPTDGQIVFLIYKAVTSARTLTITGLHFGSSVTVLTATTANKEDFLTLVYDAAVGWCLGGYDKDYV